MHHRNVAHLCYSLPSPFFVSLHLIFDAIFFPNNSFRLCMFSFTDFPENFSKVVTVVFQANYKCYVQCYSQHICDHIV